MNPKILITVERGVVKSIVCTTTAIEITVVDHDVEPAESSKLVYFRAAPDEIITPTQYENIIEEIENEQLNAQDEEE
jgi:hypothetical protein